jgi:hypothetical protein
MTDFGASFGWAFVYTLAIGSIPVAIYLLPFFVRWLAEGEDPETGQRKREIFFAMAKEGQARAVEWNRRFRILIMSFAGHCFAGKLNATLNPRQAEYWEVVVDPRRPRTYNFLQKMLNIPAYDGIHFIGPPYIADIPKYRMAWIEWGHPHLPGGGVTANKTPIPHEELISHILLQQDVYYVKVPAAETKEGVPVDVNMLFTIVITNPYKARYRVQNWLEAVTNQAEAEVRSFVASEAVLQMLTVTAGDQPGVTAAVTIADESRKELEAMLKGRLEKFKEEYGVDVRLTQIQSVELAGPDAGKYRALVTAGFEALKKKEVKIIETDATAYEIERLAAARKKEAEEVFQTISKIEGGVEMFHSQQVGGLQNLRTYFEGDPKRPRPAAAVPTESE